MPPASAATGRASRVAKSIETGGRVMSDNPSSLPNTQIVANPEGGYIGLMHLGDKLRSFMSGEMDRVRKLMVDVGLNEFGLDQPTAEGVADAAVQKHVDDAAASVQPAPDYPPAPPADEPLPVPETDQTPDAEPAADPAPAAPDEPDDAAAAEEDADAVAADADAAHASEEGKDG
jgi:hypothetical protein